MDIAEFKHSGKYGGRSVSLAHPLAGESSDAPARFNLIERLRLYIIDRIVQAGPHVGTPDEITKSARVATTMFD